MWNYIFIFIYIFKNNRVNCRRRFERRKQRVCLKTLFFPVCGTTGSAFKICSRSVCYIFSVAGIFCRAPGLSKWHHQWVSRRRVSFADTHLHVFSSHIIIVTKKDSSAPSTFHTETRVLLQDDYINNTPGWMSCFILQACYSITIHVIYYYLQFA